MSRGSEVQAGNRSHGVHSAHPNNPALEAGHTTSQNTHIICTGVLPTHLSHQAVQHEVILELIVLPGVWSQQVFAHRAQVGLAADQDAFVYAVVAICTHDSTIGVKGAKKGPQNLRVRVANAWPGSRNIDAHRVESKIRPGSDTGNSAAANLAGPVNGLHLQAGQT
jgi:hypothetical protein